MILMQSILLVVTELVVSGTHCKHQREQNVTFGTYTGLIYRFLKKHLLKRFLAFVCFSGHVSQNT